jgi:exonuclease III
MNNLAGYNLTPNLTKREFVDILSGFPAVKIMNLRSALFQDLSLKELLHPDFEGLQLVTRNSTIRPVEIALSEDCWTLIDCITNSKYLPRTLLKNGKRDGITVANQPRPIHAVSSNPADNTTTDTGPCTTTPLSSPASTPSLSFPNSSSQSSHEDCHLSRDQISARLIARELSCLHDDINALKKDILALQRPSTFVPPPYLGADFQSVKDENKFLHHKIDLLSPNHSIPPVSLPVNPSPPTPNHKPLSITTWNCRGLSNSLPYIMQLIESGSDIIALSEHWLWPYELNKLSQIHPEFDGFGYCDDRLTESCTLTRGCGGVGLLWRKSLEITPLVNVISDRFCALQLQTSSGVRITVFAVYLPTSSYSDDEFLSYLAGLQAQVSEFDKLGPVIICGDFNTHLCSQENPSHHSVHVNNFVDLHSLYIISQSSIRSGPDHTYYSGSITSTLDYFIGSASLSSSILSCFTSPPHPLNLSDHLPITLSLDITTTCISPVTPSVSSKINWGKGIDSGKVNIYSQAVSVTLRPLLNMSGQSLQQIQNEILFVADFLVSSAKLYLPTYQGNPNKKQWFNCQELKQLCNLSKEAWKLWKNDGKPLQGTTYDNMKTAKRNIKKKIRQLRAEKDRSDIQKRDSLFKSCDSQRFKISPVTYQCRKIQNEEGIHITDQASILSEFARYFSKLLTSRLDSNSQPDKMKLDSLLTSSYHHEDNILSDPFVTSEILFAIKKLKSGTSAGLDGITPEHIKHGGPVLVEWLLKVFNRILTLEEIPNSLKEGMIIPIYKRQNKDPLHLGSYRGVTIPSVLTKLLEIVVLERMNMIIEDLHLPDCLQTAYQKGISCSDAVFVTQEALLTHLRENGHPYLCFFDMEKAFDSVEFSVLLNRLFDLGINGKCWRIIKSWYTSAFSRVRLENSLSEPFPLTRGVKQGSVLSPLLFLIVMDPLLHDLRYNGAGLSVCGSFVGGSAHADDVRTIAPSTHTLHQQYNILQNFVTCNHLQLNTSKTEVLKISNTFSSETIQLPTTSINTVSNARCLGVRFHHDLSATLSVKENICKARKAFFAFGKIGAFQGSLNPLSSSSIYETCVISVLLYGCETWVLDYSSLRLLNKFQNDIGRHILKLPRNFSGSAVKLILEWPSIPVRILLRKLNFLAKLLSKDHPRKLSTRIFTSLSISDPFQVSLIQQCRMLESIIGTSILKDCLEDPENAIFIVRQAKKDIIAMDLSALQSVTLEHPSARFIAKVSQNISWNKLWDVALDKGPFGTKQLQRLIFHLTRPIFDNFICPLCSTKPQTTWFNHVCEYHIIKTHVSIMYRK